VPDCPCDIRRNVREAGVGFDGGSYGDNVTEESVGEDDFSGVNLVVFELDDYLQSNSRP
jgi:hypothetical protein